MRFDMNNLNPGVTFCFDEEKPEEGSITLRVCNGDALVEISKQSTKKRVEYRRGQRREIEEIDERLHSELVWDYCIVAWDGVEDANGTPIPCTRENKAVLMFGSPHFSQLVGDYLAKLRDDAAAHEEAVEKNLLNTSSGQLSVLTA